MSKLWCGDFETNTRLGDCHVWAYSICEIGNPDNFIYGESLDQFFAWCELQKDNPVMYFHNLKFDMEFMLYWLNEHGFTYIEDKKDYEDYTYTAMIGDMGQVYSLEVFFTVQKRLNKRTGKTVSKVKKVTFRDSLKIINASVNDIAKDFGLPISKLTIDYNKYRPVGYKLEQNEIEYIRNDVEIMARSLDFFFQNGLTKATIASDALADFKNRLCLSTKRKPEIEFRRHFPKLPIEIDKSIRYSYRGGFTYLNPKYASKKVGAGVVFDINSAYPAVMRYKELPYGLPIPFEGEYVNDPDYPLYTMTITCNFELKKGKIPSIQLKNNMSFMPNEYITSSKGELVTLCVTSVDYELMKDQYNMTDLTFHGGWKFMSQKGFFNEYIDHWINEKIDSKKSGNKAKTKTAKLMLNSLYGKFGLNPVSRKQHIKFEDGMKTTYLSDKEEREPIYIPMATFITSYNRDYIIRTSQAIRDYSLKKYGFDAYIYSDTDSIHCLLDDKDLEELKELINIHPYNLGAWDLETHFAEAKFVRQKCYIEMVKNKDGSVSKKVTVAGLTDGLAEYVTLDNIDGFTTEGLDIPDNKMKMKPVHVNGGIVLMPTPFTIKK